MSLRMRSSAWRAFSCASKRRVWSTWAVSADANEAVSGARTIRRIAMTTSELDQREAVLFGKACVEAGL